MLKPILIGVTAIFLVLLLKEKKPEFSMAISLCACVLILLFATGNLQALLTDIKKIMDCMNLPEGYGSILMKILGISFLAEFGSSLCKDAGQSAVAGSIELVGKLMILAISMPIITSLFETIRNMVV